MSNEIEDETVGLNEALTFSKPVLEKIRLIKESELFEAQRRQADTETALKQVELEVGQRVWDIQQATPGEAGEFIFYADVDERSVYATLQNLENYSRRNPGKPMTLVFDSPGGSIFDGLHLYDFLQEIKRRGHHLTTRSLGMAASMGAILLQAGNHREMSRNGFMLIHEASAFAGGKLTTMKDETALIQRLEDKLVDILAERSTLSVRQLKTKMNRKDYWLDAPEALSVGLIDAIS